MADNIKDRLKDAGTRVAENVGHVADWVKEKTGVGPGRAEGTDAGVAGIRQHMDVIASCGTKIGVVDGVEGPAIKLTKSDSPDGMHHFIPTGWVANVDRHVHLSKNSKEVEGGWKNDAQACASC